MLQHSIPYFPRFASTPERRNENINVNKYLIFLSGDRTHNQSTLQSHFVPCATTGLEPIKCREKIFDLKKNLNFLRL